MRCVGIRRRLWPEHSRSQEPLTVHWPEGFIIHVHQCSVGGASPREGTRSAYRAQRGRASPRMPDFCQLDPAGKRICIKTSQTCAYRSGESCAAAILPAGSVAPAELLGALPSVIAAFVLTTQNVTQYHWPRWEERSHGTAELVARAHARLPRAVLQRLAPISVWVHVADVGWPELPLPMPPLDSRAVTLSTVCRERESSHLLFPDYSFARWPAIGHTRGSLQEFASGLVLAGSRPATTRLHQRAVFVGDVRMHEVRRVMEEIAFERPDDLEVIHVPQRKAGEERHARHVPFDELARWSLLLDLPGGGWSGRLKFLPLLGRPLIVVNRAAWGWADGSQRQPFVHYRLVNATAIGSWQQAAYEFDPDDVLREIAWCKEHPHEAAEMARRAQRHALQAFTDERVDDQAAAVLLRALQDFAGIDRDEDTMHTHDGAAADRDDGDGQQQTCSQ